jgi:4'-phosphopantetheinyl transferase
MIDFVPWSQAAGGLHLDAQGVHLWRIRAGPDGAEPAELWSMLSPAEQTRALRFAAQTLRDRYIRAHGGLRRILSVYLRRSPQEIAFTVSKQGKPSVLQPAAGLGRRVEFSLTGSYDLAVVAVSLDRPIGVDCELIRPRPELIGIARRMFSQQVAEALEGMPGPQRLDAFYAAWTALEAQVKADGCGLFRPRDAAATPLTTAHVLPQSGYMAAVAREQLPATDLWQGYEWSGCGRLAIAPGRPISSPSPAIPSPEKSA